MGVRQMDSITSLYESAFRYQFLNTISPIFQSGEITLLSKIISDEEISQYISERKLFDCSSLLRKFNPTTVKGHKRKVVEFNGVDGNKFKLSYRENVKNPLDFCVGLYLLSEETGEEFILKRYNGKNHWHANKCPAGNRFFDFHIHKATKHCQERREHEENFATITNEYSTARQALECILRDCGFDFKQSNFGMWGF